MQRKVPKETAAAILSVKSDGRKTPIHGLKFEWSLGITCFDDLAFLIFRRAVVCRPSENKKNVLVHITGGGGMDNILEMRHITKDFSGVKALDDVNLVVRQGEIHALCGENGAGCAGRQDSRNQ